MVASSNEEIYRARCYENQGLSALVNLIEPTLHRVLDVGCGNGANMQLLSTNGHQMVGVTLSISEARACLGQGLQCLVCDITRGLPFADHTFDALLLSHILEHVPWPEDVLKGCIRLLKPGGKVYVVLPNVVHIVQRWQFLLGRFLYSESGVMDRTHLRFFDFSTARHLVENAGLEVTYHVGVGQCPVGPLRELMPLVSKRIDRLATHRWPGIFSFHIIVVGVP